MQPNCDLDYEDNKTDTESNAPPSMLYGIVIGLVLAFVLLKACDTNDYAYAHMTDPVGCELLIVKHPDQKEALFAGLSDDRTTFNYGYDTDGNGWIDLIVGYQVAPPAQRSPDRPVQYLPNPVAYWKDSNNDGMMDHLFIPVGGNYRDCYNYVHLMWNGDQWVLAGRHTGREEKQK